MTNQTPSCSYKYSDSLAFIQLVKLPKGSNVEGSDIFRTLFSSDDINDENDKTTDEDDSSELDEYDLLTDSEPEVGVEPNERAQANIAGYIARRVVRFLKCQLCKATLVNEGPTFERDDFILHTSKGSLLYPSAKLYDLTWEIEKCLLEHTKDGVIEAFGIINVSKDLNWRTDLPRLGCEAHDITQKTKQFYITCRAHQICRTSSRVHGTERQLTAASRKKSKLI
ncbi:hypothetical protein DMENIID0001_098580 [Sergentomyia squamirostris]